MRPANQGSFATRDKPPPDEDDYVAIAIFLFVAIMVLTPVVLVVKAVI